MSEVGAPHTESKRPPKDARRCETDAYSRSYCARRLGYQIDTSMSGPTCPNWKDGVPLRICHLPQRAPLNGPGIKAASPLAQLVMADQQQRRVPLSKQALGFFIGGIILLVWVLQRHVVLNILSARGSGIRNHKEPCYQEKKEKYLII